MKSIKTNLNENSVIAFSRHGEGNRRKLDCLGRQRIGYFTDNLFKPVDEEGNEIEGEYTDRYGNGVELTTADARTGIGTIYISIDGVSYTIYTKRLGGINYKSEEAYAMAHCSDLDEESVVAYFCQGESDENAKAIINKLDPDINDYFDEEEED